MNGVRFSLALAWSGLPPTNAHVFVHGGRAVANTEPTKHGSQGPACRSQHASQYVSSRGSKLYSVNTTCTCRLCVPRYHRLGSQVRGIQSGNKRARHKGGRWRTILRERRRLIRRSLRRASFSAEVPALSAWPSLRFPRCMAPHWSHISTHGGSCSRGRQTRSHDVPTTQPVAWLHL